MPVIDLQKDNEELRERVAELERERDELAALVAEEEAVGLMDAKSVAQQALARRDARVAAKALSVAAGEMDADARRLCREGREKEAIPLCGFASIISVRAVDLRREAEGGES